MSATPVRAISAASPPHPRVKSHHDKKATTQETAKAIGATCAELAALQIERASRDKTGHETRDKAGHEAQCEVRRKAPRETTHQVARGAAR